MTRINVYYATRSKFKIEEIEAVTTTCSFTDSDGQEKRVGERFNFVFSEAKTDEPLEVNLTTMVRHKVVSAYKSILMPCIVEHAGLIFAEYSKVGYPGGLTQPMMDSLGADDFIKRNNAAGIPAIARAVIGYCDGMSVHIFTGETAGRIAAAPRGGREFYWDTIFVPDELGGDTYAEVSQDPSRGVATKMTVSQSYRAMRRFLE